MSARDLSQMAGIKTVHQANGTVEEEAFDPATLPAIKAARPGKTLTS